MKTSRLIFSEVQKKAGAFPFNIRCLEDEKKARLGLQEAVQHALVKPYDVMYVDSAYFVSHFTESVRQLHPCEYLCCSVPLHNRSPTRWSRPRISPARMV